MDTDRFIEQLADGARQLEMKMQQMAEDQLQPVMDPSWLVPDPTIEHIMRTGEYPGEIFDED